MACLVTLLSLGAGACAGILLYRLLAFERRLRSRAACSQSHDELARSLVRLAMQAADASLFADQGGLAAVEVRFREPQDSCTNLGELVEAMLAEADATKFAALVQLAKCAYQLQHTVGLPVAALDDCLRLIQARLLAETFMGKPIGCVRSVAVGSVLDPQTMMALTGGTHVKQPLGLIVFDREGKVLSKAKVLCE